MKKLLVIGFFVLILVYVIFQARYLILGPGIDIETPQDNALVDVGVTVVKGTARNISSLSLDDRPIFTDTAGHFEEKLIVHEGLNIIKLRAQDRFGREKEEILRIVAK